MRRGFTFLLVALALTACAPSGGVGRNWEKGERGTVARVMDGDTFALNTGQVVRLASIEAPSFAYRGQKAMPYAEKSKRALEQLILGEQVQLYYPGLTRDSYDRALAQVSLLGDEPGNVNAEMVQRGAAWYRFYPDTSEGSGHLVGIEAEARQEKRGLWNETEGPVIASDDDLPDPGFGIVRGLVTSSETGADDKCQVALNQLALKIEITSGRTDDVCPLTGSRIEARGWVRDGTLRTDGLNIRSVKSDPEDRKARTPEGL